MKSFGNYLRNGRIFLSTSGLFLIFSLIVVFFIDNDATPAFSELYHPQWLNIICINITFMGDSFFVLLLSVFIMFYLEKKRLALKLLLGMAFTRLPVQFINHVAIYDSFVFYVEQGQYLLSGTEKNPSLSNTIISSHTAIAFMWSTILSIKLKKPLYQYAFFTIAVFVAGSRLYLAPHAFFHIITGAATGLVSGLSVYLLQINVVNSLKKSTRLLQLQSSVSGKTSALHFH